ncbi:SpaH/EbpB family LPXTG-anchored major pilin [Georgenia sp. H159]|uniref:SpaH/EbpB family LPXTG-anchored major pilin n=1 Tax=Georgenia sp. H159 TaxID=3076115 RepID=UPI002D78A07F|nr:SpaH/EbpB family LPXTG-anchored major pilin [Georgenia sp. H159]
MNSSTGRLARWAVAAAGALTLGLLGVAAPATATGGPNLETDASGSITVHKFAEPAAPTGLPHDGSPVDTTGLTALEGVTFTVQRVTTIDLATNLGWDAAAGLTAGDVLDAPADYPLDAGTNLATDAAGTAAFTGLPIGVYLVAETGVGDNPVAVKAEPFLVSVPLPTADNTWLYDVHVYPKNSVTGIAKDVSDAEAYGLGDIVTWKVSVDVPELAAGKTFTEFRIVDDLDPRLELRGTTVRLGDTTLTEDVEYTVTEDGSAASVVLTADGRDLLLAEGQGGTVTVELTTAVIEIGDGIITNDAEVHVNEFTGTTNTVDTRWGGLEIVKVGKAGDVTSHLQGAEFQVFRTAAAAEDASGPVAVNGETTFTTEEDGRILIEGLKAGTYWIVETKAPVGYVGTTDPIEVTVTAGSLAEAASYEVLNSQRAAFDLPLTGAAGTVLFSMAGLGLIAVAIGAAMRHRSRTPLAA